MTITHTSSTAGPRRHRVRRRLATLVLSAAIGTTAVIGASAPSADAAVRANGWTFGTDVFCDRTLHQVSMSMVAISGTAGAPADVAYRIYLRYNNGAWSGPTSWRVLRGRDVYYDGPRLMFASAGSYQFYVEYSLYTTTGWTQPFAEFANHRTSIGGITSSSGGTSCYA